MRDLSRAFAVIASVVILLAGSGPSSTGLAAGPTTERVSLTAGGGQAAAASAFHAISADGRYVAFHSNASNLVGGDSNGVADVFVRDRLTKTTERVSVSSGGVQGNAASGDVASGRRPAISADGRFVAFESAATNLVDGDTNFGRDIFVRDRFNGTTERVSVAPDGTQANLFSQSPAISADGRFVAFESLATNLVPGTLLTATLRVFVRDRMNGTTEPVSVSDTGQPGFGNRPAISTDGRYVAFVGDGELVPGAVNAFDVFVRDRVLRKTQRVSVGGFFTGSVCCPSISADGRYVVWAMNSGGEIGVFVRDRVVGTSRVDVTPNGTPSICTASGLTAISADGRFIGFLCRASDLVVNDITDVFVRDQALAVTERVSVPDGGGLGNNKSLEPSISADGRFVAFTSAATNLVSGDTNNVTDVFLRDRATGSAPQLSIGDLTFSEGGFGERTVLFPVTLSATTGQAVSFRYSTEDVTARGGADFRVTNGTATIPANTLGTTVAVTIFGDATSEPDETMHVNIDVPVNATIGDGQATATIRNDDNGLVLVGTLDLSPANATVAVGDPLTYRLSWTVPSGSWHDLNTIEVQIGEDGSVMWLRFDEASRALSLYNHATGRFGPSFPAGHQAVLRSGPATLYLTESRVTAAGPNSPEVVLQLTLSFGRQAAAGEYPVLVRATDDFGNVQDFERGGTLTIVPRRR